MTEVAVNAPVATLNEKKLLTDAAIPEAEDEIFESTGKNIPVDALETLKFEAVVANPEEFELPEVIA